MRSKALLALPLALVLSGAAALAAQQPAPMPPHGERVIRVSAVGQVEAAPDEAHLDFAVETMAATAAQAARENAARMERVIAALVAAGVPRASVETRGYQVYPEYAPQPQPNAEPTIRGYRVSNTVTVETRDIGKVGTLLDAALRAGANRVDAVRFGLSNPEAARGQAIRRATESARRDAEALAAALGVRLGAVVDASTTGEPPRPFPVMMRGRAEAMDMAQSVTTPIQPGEQTVTATVSLVFSIGG